jgi:hypothetical protein
MEVKVEKTQKELLAASRAAEMSEIATSVLLHIGQMLNSVNHSASLVSDQVRQSKIANVVHVGALIREQEADLGRFMKDDPRGQKLPAYIAQLAEYLADEQTALAGELESLRQRINEILALQQKYAELAGVADLDKVNALIEDAVRLNDGLRTRNGTPPLTEAESRQHETTLVF